MSTRRMFLKQTTATAVAATIAFRAALASQRVKSILRRDDTTLRYPIMGDNWHMSWAADDRQYTSLCDGFAAVKRPKGMYNTRLLAIEGDARGARFEDVSRYPELMLRWWALDETARYYGFGTLAIDGYIYQFLSTPNKQEWNGAKLIYSPDNGRTWHNQNGTTPVAWEAKDAQSHESLIFIEEPQRSFSLISLLQMGRGYELNRDGYVYGYSPNGMTDGSMNELVLFRVRRNSIRRRDAYEYFAGHGSKGSASWSKDIKARVPIHTFPRGWAKGYCWMPSVTYNAPLGLYMMASWGWSFANDGKVPTEASYLGFWTASSPWGPWSQIHEETAWLPRNDPTTRAYQPQIAPKWIAPDGKSFWLVWSEFQMQDKDAFARSMTEFDEKVVRAPVTDDEMARVAALYRAHAPGYSFNVQRVDLVL